MARVVRLRISNPIESVRDDASSSRADKGRPVGKIAKLMVLKLVHAAAKTWRRPNGIAQSFEL